MKQTKKAKSQLKEKEKDNYLKSTFIVPVVYSVITAVLMIVTIIIAVSSNVANISIARTIIQMSALSLSLSPSALILCVFMGTKHRTKHPDGSTFYRQFPLAISFLVIGLQVLYMVFLATAK